MAALMRKVAVTFSRHYLMLSMSTPARIAVCQTRNNLDVIFHKRCLSQTPRLFIEDNPLEDNSSKLVNPAKLRHYKYVFSEEEIEAGLKYIDSEEYLEKYGKKPVWAGYRRNHKGQIPPQKTRKMCIRKNNLCSNACPICRDQELVVHHRNVKLLQQFVSPHSGQMYTDLATGVCQRQYQRLQREIEEARYQGLLPFTVPHIEYDYSQYYGEQSEKNKAIQ
ncbi:small ribosomal subunit protein mS40-like [Glandiceps talaboti]